MAILNNLGCKLNQYEGWCLQKKYATSKDVIILNTCAVTAEAEAKSLKRFRHLIRKFPRCKLIVTGCLCSLHPEKFNRAAKIIDISKRTELIREILPVPERSRYFLKIQDGCNQNCTYCVVSRLRRRIESRPLVVIKKEVEWAVSLGFREIVLVGANIGLYGIDTGSSFIDLLESLQQIRSLPRLRLSSIEPHFISRDLISRLKDLPFCRHFHIPIQSADDGILAIMARQYRANELEKSIELLHKNFRNLAVGADIIVGFPGEGASEFQQTYDFIKRQPFTHLHVFPYSPRPITPAYQLGDPVPYQEKKQRLWQLKELITKKNYEFRRRLVGKIFDVIIEEKKNGLAGLTDNYIRVRINEDCKERELVPVRITEIEKDITRGIVIKS